MLLAETQYFGKQRISQHFFCNGTKPSKHNNNNYSLHLAAKFWQLPLALKPTLIYHLSTQQLRCEFTFQNLKPQNHICSSTYTCLQVALKHAEASNSPVNSVGINTCAKVCASNSDLCPVEIKNYIKLTSKSM